MGECLGDSQTCRGSSGVIWPASALAPMEMHLGSSVDAQAYANLHQEHTRPRTRLQSGIHKDKVCIDGTIRYNLFSTGEPCTVEEA